MTMRMLIDARHREETRVAVVKGNQIEEFDFESAEHKQLKGNIYLAKVTRVEPSLQAAFVDYGGNRHGFLAFSEIHPDYYQIPKADRDRLLAEEAEAAAEEAAAREIEEEEDDAPSDIMRSDVADEEQSDFIEIDTDTSIDTIDVSEGEMPDDGDYQDDSNGYGDGENGDSDNGYDENAGGENAGGENGEGGDRTDRDRNRRGRNGRRSGRNGSNNGSGENGGNGAPRGRGAAKASDTARAKRIALRRRYKIQDVVHRRQVLLVQVVKEERGNKGAALTTYLSLAGRYCVLMPNTSHGGGISRKISSATDRKRLKSIVADLQLPRTMGCIIRTAGLSRTKVEIKRDFDYLARLWDEIRDRTLHGAAPMLIHSDSDLIRRAIRDIYNRDIEEVIVEGEEGYRAAKDFMKLLMPSHAKRVRQYADPVPLFQRFGAEDQLSAMYQPLVQLKSGGYIVINPTEALVSIDINSGRSTKEHGIEATAVSTNLEAAREIARQLRLRDMAGLVVIDFIDMENYSNIRKVERAMKDALKNDRARIQVGKISSFGLMEMSRQRLRTGVLEASTRECPHCEGTGLVRTASSSALSALRLMEEEAARGKGSLISLSASNEAAIYVLNNKRAELAAIEDRYGVMLEVLPSGDIEGAKMIVSASGPRPEKRVDYAPMIEPYADDDDDDIVDDYDGEDEDDRDAEGETGRSDKREPSRARDGEEESDGERANRKKRRRRGRRGKGRREDGTNEGAQFDGTEMAPESEDGTETSEETVADAPAEDDEGKAKRPRRRRGGRTAASVEETANAEEATADAVAEPAAVEVMPEEEAPKPKRRTRAKKAEVAATEGETPAPVAEDGADADAKPKRRTRAKKADAVVEEKADGAAPEAATEAEQPEKPKRRSRAKKPVDADETSVTRDAPTDAAAVTPTDDTSPEPDRQPETALDAGAPDTDTAIEPAAQSAMTDDATPTVEGNGDTKTNTDAQPNSDDGYDGPPRKGWWQRTFG